MQSNYIVDIDPFPAGTHALLLSRRTDFPWVLVDASTLLLLLVVVIKHYVLV